MRMPHAKQSLWHCLISALLSRILLIIGPQVSDLLTAVERYTRKQGVDMRHLFERFDWNGGSASTLIHHLLNTATGSASACLASEPRRLF
jgi:hypothetical protein